MLRINLLHDEAFRNDILQLVKNGLREAIPTALAQKFAEDDWLEKRFDSALSRFDLAAKIATKLASRDYWSSQVVRKAIDEAVSAKIDQVVLDVRSRVERAAEGKIREMETNLRSSGQAVIDDFSKKMRAEETFIRQIVGEELRKRLAG